MNEINVKVDKVDAVIKAIAKLVKKQVLVGIPESTAARDGTEISNAQIGYVNEKGSPVNNIPARPFLVPGVQSAFPGVDISLKKAAIAAIAGDDKNVTVGLSSAGLKAQNAVRRKINSGDFAPLSAATLRARAARGRKGAIAELRSRAEGNAPSTELAKPLIDTGALRNSITYVIRETK